MRRRGEPSDPPAPGTAWTAALRLFGRRDYTETEIRAKLSERGYDAETVDATIARLRTERIVDDGRAARSHVRTASRVKGRGKLRIRRELEARGLDAEVIREAIGDVPESDETAAIAKFVARKRPRDGMTLAARQRLFRQLLQRGFPSTLISRALRSSGAESDED
jgi:regulatory protein